MPRTMQTFLIIGIAFILTPLSLGSKSNPESTASDLPKKVYGGRIVFPDGSSVSKIGDGELKSDSGPNSSLENSQAEKALQGGSISIGSA